MESGIGPFPRIGDPQTGDTIMHDVMDVTNRLVENV
jgi:hypothetical protein